jgi:hypothetical protein
MGNRLPSLRGAIALCAIARLAYAQDPVATLDSAARGRVIDALLGELNRAYVFPAKAEEMDRSTRAKLTSGAYDAIDRGDEFARTLTRDLQAITRDKHLRVTLQTPGPGSSGGGGPPQGATPFGETRRLDGNVAYVELRSFGFPAERVRSSVERVMSEAADADAMIIDVRANGGGGPALVALVSSYLFGDTAVHLNSLYFRPLDRTDHFYTNPRVEGKKFGPTKPVYVLTSERTFSAAEEFTYNLQSLKRATIVGDTTGGGAHPGGSFRLPHGLRVFVPSGRAINPITKTNWEGVGVIPDVPVATDRALEAAHKLALARRPRTN